MTPLDPIIGLLLIPLAVWILISGIDDVFIDLLSLIPWFARHVFRARSVSPPRPADLAAAPIKRIAVFVPLWHEYQVIERMLSRNVDAAQYPAFDFFIGVYPNDLLTLQAVTAAAQRSPRVHIALCPHDGPTSKADNLNWIYQRMLDHEREHNCRFEIIVTHDAEDLIHPEEFHWLNYYAQYYDMVQIPVLPLPTPLWKLTHGLYCDDFAEFQLRDLPVRMILRGFLPSSGVGTGFSRAALDKLAQDHNGHIFDPDCLTEDYENGLKLARLGCSQIFVPLTFRDGYWVATREYFPMSFKTAVKQRSRWVAGIALQSWERNGWGRSLGESYWFWRDRKGLVGNPVSLLANWLLIYGAFTWAWSYHQGTAWGLGEQATGPLLEPLFWSTFLLQIWRTTIRFLHVKKVYQRRFALLLPLRMLWANWVNCFASLLALKRFVVSKWKRKELEWGKTSHYIPSQAGLAGERRKLGEILVKAFSLPPAVLEEALARKPSTVKLGDWLVAQGYLTEDQLYDALAMQQEIPHIHVNPAEVRRRVVRSLPASCIRKYRVLPVKVMPGNLYVAGPDVPTEQMHRELHSHVNLEIRFQLVTPTHFEQLCHQLLDDVPSPHSSDASPPSPSPQASGGNLTSS